MRFDLGTLDSGEPFGLLVISPPPMLLARCLANFFSRYRKCPIDYHGPTGIFLDFTLYNDANILTKTEFYFENMS